MSDKPKVAFYWCASCGGCEESIVDLAEDILMVVENVDIVMWPVAMDFKRKDVEAMSDGSIVATLINGGVRSNEQEEMVRLLRRKSQYLIAHGACAVMGGVPGLANQFTREQILKYVYEDAPGVVNADGTRPQVQSVNEGRDLSLPALHDRVRALDQVVHVDYYLPGCAPAPGNIKDAVVALLKGELPPNGAVLAPDIALCSDCPRLDSKPEDPVINEWKRPHLTLLDPELCFIAQGIPCMGPATRSGCGVLCIKGLMPCTGCYGPVSGEEDHGAKILSFLASSIAAKDADEVERVLAGIPDPVGTFYRYGLPKSLLRGKVSNG